MTDDKPKKSKQSTEAKVSDKKLLVGIAALLVLMFVLMAAIVIKLTSGR